MMEQILNQGREPVNLLEQHLRIMSVETANDPQLRESDWQEQLRVRKLSQNVSPLSLKKSRSHLKWLSTGFAIAAGLLLLVYQRGYFENDLSPKGIGLKVFVVSEMNGERKVFNEGLTLPNGARVNADLLVDKPSIGFIAVVSGDHRILTPMDDILTNALIITPKQHAYFKNGFELDVVNEQESLAVVVCERAQFYKKYASLNDFAVNLETLLTTGEKSDPISGCEQNTYKLR